MKRSIFLVCLILAVPASAEEPPEPAMADVVLRHGQATIPGESLYVLGDLPQLGAWDVTRARRMVPEAGGQWTLRVGLPAGASFRYAFVVRWNGAESLPAPGNVRWVSPVQAGRAPGTTEERRVQVRYFSGWAQVFLRHLAEDGGERDVALQRVGPGRRPDEWAWAGEVRTRAGELAFFLHDGGQGRDYSPARTRYRTTCSAFTLASGKIHAGQPALDELRGPTSSQVLVVRGVASRLLGNRRDIFVYLPRGYDSSWRRYPVLYLHDGQNLFGSDAPYGGWQVDQTADRLIDAGALEELIIVGVGNTPARALEYVPEADGGLASRYGRFLIEELKPWIDARLRTKPEREHTGMAGSSLGGLVSLYLAWERPDVFSRCASLSGSFWLQRWTRQRLGRRPDQPLRVWLDSGNSGGDTADGLETTLLVRDRLLRAGFSLGRDLEHFVDYGASHNEVAWRARLGKVLCFLFPAR